MLNTLPLSPIGQAIQFLERHERQFRAVHYKRSSVFIYELTHPKGMIHMEMYVRPRTDHLGFQASLLDSAGQQIRVAHSAPLSLQLHDFERVAQMESYCILQIDEILNNQWLSSPSILSGITGD